MENNPITILVADDHPVFRRRLRMIITTDLNVISQRALRACADLTQSTLQTNDQSFPCVLPPIKMGSPTHTKMGVATNTQPARHRR